jgi:hypothetical protein
MTMRIDRVQTVKTTNDGNLMRNFVKYWGICAILIFATFLPFQAYSSQERKKPTDIDWETIDAVEAIAIANEWKWSQKDVKSYVTAREVVFEFSDGTKKEILLPEERMLVAVAPYIRQTHK